MITTTFLPPAPTDNFFERLQALMLHTKNPLSQSVVDHLKKLSDDAYLRIEEAKKAEQTLAHFHETTRGLLDMAAADQRKALATETAEHQAALKTREDVAAERERAVARQEQALDRRSAALDDREVQINRRASAIAQAAASIAA